MGALGWERDLLAWDLLHHKLQSQVQKCLLNVSVTTKMPTAAALGGD